MVTFLKFNFLFLYSFLKKKKFLFLYLIFLFSLHFFHPYVCYFSFLFSLVFSPPHSYPYFSSSYSFSTFSSTCISTSPPYLHYCFSFSTFWSTFISKCLSLSLGLKTLKHAIHFLTTSRGNHHYAPPRERKIVIVLCPLSLDIVG